jgi:hypothetical protein
MSLKRSPVQPIPEGRIGLFCAQNRLGVGTENPVYGGR